MSRGKNTAIIGTAAAALVVGVTGAGVATAAGDDDAMDTAITGPALERASQAALAHTDEGTVTGTEVGDEEGAYEVEVTFDSGAETDVHLDSSFNILGAEAESGQEDES